jgi:glycerol-3-phosphate dehydrogenase
MKRDISLMHNSTFDAVIIGGGIHGATVFHRFAAAGLRVALVEKGDFGGATSANSLKVLHSGLRYLQHLNVRRIRESIRSRKIFMEMAPHLISPMPCIMPTHGFGVNGRLVMAAALTAFDIISCDRNAGAPPKNRVGRGRILSRKQCLQIGPGINREGLSGAALWYDDMIVNTERMTLSFIKAAVRQGGICANYLEVGEILMQDGRVRGVKTRDALSGESITLKTPLIINAAGPWCRQIEKLVNPALPDGSLCKSVNLVIDKALFPGHGVGLAGSEEHTDEDARFKRNRRLLFFVPWREKTIIGTTCAYATLDRHSLQVSKKEIADLLLEINTIYPPAELRQADVLFSHVGLVPGHPPKNWAPDKSTPQTAKHSTIVDHGERGGVAGLFTIQGVKYTTAPSIAVALLQLLSEKGALPDLRRHKARTSPRNKAPADQTGLRLQFPHLEETYGPDSSDIFAIIEEDAACAKFLAFRSPLLVAEIIYFIRCEMAEKLADVILRRINSAHAGCAEYAELEQIASIMAGEKGWGQDKVRDEINSVLKHYRETLGLDVQPHHAPRTT